MYAKIFRSLWDGTLAEKWETWAVFVFLLAHADSDGVIEMTQGAIARRSCIPQDLVEAAIATLTQPDPESRSAGEDGRRMVPLDDRGWGWQIVNYRQYRNYKDSEQRKLQNREAQRRRRESALSALRGLPVSNGHQMSAQGEGEEEGKEEVKEPNTSPEVDEIFSLEAPLPTISGTEWEPTKAMVEAWRAAYPDVDVVGTMGEMRAWLVSNPSRMKTTRGMGRFVNEWLKREAEKYAGQEA